MSLWIGDKVLLKKSGRFGIVTSIEKNGKIKVTVENTFIYTNIANVQVIENEDYVFPDWVYLNEDVYKRQNLTAYLISISILCPHSLVLSIMTRRDICG